MNSWKPSQAFYLNYSCNGITKHMLNLNKAEAFKLILWWQYVSWFVSVILLIFFASLQFYQMPPKRQIEKYIPSNFIDSSVWNSIPLPELSTNLKWSFGNKRPYDVVSNIQKVLLTSFHSFRVLGINRLKSIISSINTRKMKLTCTRYIPALIEI